MPEFKTDQEKKDYEVFFKDTYWQQGFIKFKDVEKVDNLGAYFCKYLGKDMFDERMFNRKKYFCSRTLKRPKELYNEKADTFMMKVKDNSKLLYDHKTESDWIGRVDYGSYKIEDEKTAEKEALNVAV